MLVAGEVRVISSRKIASLQAEVCKFSQKVVANMPTLMVYYGVPIMDVIGGGLSGREI